MSDRRQVLQEAAAALGPFAREADIAETTTRDVGRFHYGELRRARSALALIRASLAEAELHADLNASFLLDRPVLTQSEPTEGEGWDEYQRMADHYARQIVERSAAPFEINGHSVPVNTTILRERIAVALRAQAALPVPADRSGEPE